MNTTEKVKTGALLAGGYVLGRTKKGRLAITVAMWVTGANNPVQPQRLLREGLVGLAQSPQGAELVAQLRGPMALAAQRAAVATVQSQAQVLTDALIQRNAALEGGQQSSSDGAGSQEASSSGQQSSGEQGGQEQEPSSQEQDGGQEQGSSEQQASQEQSGQEQGSAEEQSSGEQAGQQQGSSSQEEGSGQEQQSSGQQSQEQTGQKQAGGEQGSSEQQSSKQKGSQKGQSGGGQQGEPAGEGSGSQGQQQTASKGDDGRKDPDRSSSPDRQPKQRVSNQRGAA